MKKSFIIGSLVVLSLIFSGSVGADGNSGPKPFDGAELNKFIEDYSALTQWKSEKNRSSGNLQNPLVMAGMQFNDEFGATLKEKGWDAERFFYLLNHVSQGVMQERSRLRQQAAEARFEQQMAEANARMNAQRAEFEKQNHEQAQRAEAWIKDQLAAQKKQVRENPYMHPLQKRNIMKFLNRSSSEAKRVAPPKFDFELARKKAEAQSKKWKASVRRSIQIIRYIRPNQKQIILANIDKVNTPFEAAEPMEMPTQEEMMAQMQEQRKAWITKQIEQVKANKGYSDERRAQIIKRLHDFAQNRRPEPSKRFGILPEAEDALIKKNAERLIELLSAR